MKDKLPDSWGSWLLQNDFINTFYEIRAHVKCRRLGWGATQGQIDGSFCQLPYKCHQNRVGSAADWLEICPWVTSKAWRVVGWVEVHAVHSARHDVFVLHFPQSAFWVHNFLLLLRIKTWLILVEIDKQTGFWPYKDLVNVFLVHFPQPLFWVLRRFPLLLRMET